MSQSVLRPRRAPRPRTVPLHRSGPLRKVGVVLVWVFVASNLAGLLWVLLQSFRDTRAILDQPWGLPEGWALDNFVTAWSEGGFAIATWNSVIAAVVSSVATVALAAPAAYYLSRTETWSARGLTTFFILGLGVPIQVILIPVFVMMSRAGLTDSLLGLNLVYIATGMPFTVFLLTGFFRSLPTELEEAAALDGVSPAMTFWRIMLPLARGGLLTAFVLQLIAHWNETLLALTLLQSTENYTLPLALISFVRRQTYSGADWGGLFAGICIVVLPMLIVYVWLGRKLSEGLTVGIGK